VVVLVVVWSSGKVVVGALIGVAAALPLAWAASGENASNPKMATAPTRIAGTANRRAISLRRTAGIYLSRNKQE
jgi:hypothetical protein